MFWDGTRWVDESRGTTLSRAPLEPRGRMARIGDAIATAGMVIGLVALFMPFAAAQATGALLTVSPDHGSAGAMVEITGRSFPARSRVQVTWDGAAAGMPAVRVGPTGGFTTKIVIPNSPEGAHTFAIIQTTSKSNKTRTLTATTAIADVEFTLTALGDTPPLASPTPPPGEPTATGPAPSATPPGATSGPTPTTGATADPGAGATPGPTSAVPPTTPPTAQPTIAPTARPTTEPTPQPTAGPTAPPTTGYVRASGTHLTLGGEPFRMTGFNIYNANSRGNCSYSLGYANSALGDLLAATGPAQNVFRAWFYQDLATTNGVRDWSAFDHTIKVAKANHVRIIATLGDQWGSCDSGSPTSVYKDEGWYLGGYASEVGPGTTETYRDFVAEIVARYRSEPTILAWQLMNEAEIKPNRSSGCSANAASILKTWAADVSGLVKSIDSNHLVSLGTMGGGQCGGQGSDYKFVHSLADIDLCEYHDYGSTAPMPGDQWNGLAVRISQCAALGKPLFVGETGQKGMSLADRAAVFAAKFAAQFRAGVAGELIWSLHDEAHGGSTTDNYHVGPSDPAVDVLGQY